MFNYSLFYWLSMKNKVVYEKEWGMYGKFYMYRNVLVNFFVYVNIYFCYENEIIVYIYICVWYVYNVYLMYNN